jgi:hypothetical protein
MPWKKGQSGNPKGRKTAGLSLAEQIQTSATPERMAKWLTQMWALCSESHGDPRARVGASEWMSKHGWPSEASGKTTIQQNPDGSTTVIHEHHNS